MTQRSIYKVDKGAMLVEPLHSTHIEQLLHDLQPGRPLNARQEAVAELTELSVSNLQVVSALIAVLESDPAFLVRKAARESLQVPAHQEILQRHPDLMKKALESVSPVGKQSDQDQSADSHPSDDLPEDVLQAQLQKKRFKALTPVFGLASVGACFGFFLLLGAKSMTLKDWLTVAPFCFLFALGILATFRLKQRELERWEEDIKDKLNR